MTQSHTLSPANEVKEVNLDLCIGLDTTKSMDLLIKSARDSITSIVEDIEKSKLLQGKKVNVRVAIIGFKDYASNPVCKILDFSDVETAKNFLSKLEASGGDDIPEAVESALNEMIKLGWRKPKDDDYQQGIATVRAGLFAGDAPGHACGYPGDDSYPTPSSIPTIGKNYSGVLDSLENSVPGLTIHTLRLGTNATAEKVFKDIANRTFGTYSNTTNDFKKKALQAIMNQLSENNLMHKFMLQAKAQGFSNDETIKYVQNQIQLEAKAQGNEQLAGNYASVESTSLRVNHYESAYCSGSSTNNGETCAKESTDENSYNHPKKQSSSAPVLKAETKETKTIEEIEEEIQVINDEIGDYLAEFKRQLNDAQLQEAQKNLSAYVSGEVKQNLQDSINQDYQLLTQNQAVKDFLFSLDKLSYNNIVLFLERANKIKQNAEALDDPLIQKKCFDLIDYLKKDLPTDMLRFSKEMNESQLSAHEVNNIQHRLILNYIISAIENNEHFFNSYASFIPHNIITTKGKKVNVPKQIKEIYNAIINALKLSNLDCQGFFEKSVIPTITDHVSKHQSELSRHNTGFFTNPYNGQQLELFYLGIKALQNATLETVLDINKGGNLSTNIMLNLGAAEHARRYAPKNNAVPAYKK